jgi:hypothetical protein
VFDDLSCDEFGEPADRPHDVRGPYHHLVTPARTAMRIRIAGTKISIGHCSTNRSSTGRLPLGPRPIWTPALSVAARVHQVHPGWCRRRHRAGCTAGSGDVRQRVADMRFERRSSRGRGASPGDPGGVEHLTSGGAAVPPATSSHGAVESSIFTGDAWSGRGIVRPDPARGFAWICAVKARSGPWQRPSRASITSMGPARR